MRKDLVKREETIWLIKIMLMLAIICGFSYLNSIDHTFNEQKAWYDTWKCKKCGYDNYEGIGSCPICGTKKSNLTNK